MPALLNRHATPMITGLFLISLISGVALFFHLGSAWFHGMHEWLSLVLIVPFGLHLWKNWRAMRGYFRRPAFLGAMALSVLAALAFVMPQLLAPAGTGRAGPPQFALAHRLMEVPLSDAAPVSGLSALALDEALVAAGYPTGASLAERASTAGRSEGELAAFLNGLDS